MTNQEVSTEKRIIILGAGPTGIGAAYRLHEMGYRNWAIYERNAYVGGLATSFEDSAGFTYDIGGHVMFSHYEYFDRFVDKMLGEDYTEIMREAWVWIMDRFVPYPFQNNIRHMPPEVILEIVMGLVEAHKTPEKVKQASTFAELIDAQFGEGLAKHFMRPYNFKVWAHPPAHMSRDWLGERVAMPDLGRILRNILMEQDDVSWGPNNKFKYPLRGGTGGLYSPVVPLIKDHLHLGKSAVAVDPVARQVRFADGEVVDYDWLLSTMPLDLLINRAEGAPDSVRRATRGLHHSSGLFVGVGVARPQPTEKCWIYFPESSSPFYRVTYLSHYSPYITPDENHFLLLTETSYSEHKPEDKRTIVDRVVHGLLNTKMLEQSDLDRIASTYLIDVDYSYPVPTVDRSGALATIQPWLMQHDIYSRGRFGAWEYEIGNMDHSVMQGVELVNRWLLGEPEKTWINFEQPMLIAVHGDGHKARPNGGKPAAGEVVTDAFKGSGLVAAGEAALTPNGGGRVA